MTISDLNTWLTKIPKVELHVHLEGSVQPKTLLVLANKYGIGLPSNDVEGLRKWYTFKDFDHFAEIYAVISSCLRTADDIELITREFLAGQAEQHILYSEVTFTPFSQWINNNLSYQDQMGAVNKARAWAEKELGVSMGVILDIPRIISAEDANTVAEWVIQGNKNGVIALGLGGPEVGNPPERYQQAYDLVHQAGIPCILHAGETAGSESMWSAIRCADTKRIGHGVHALEDPSLVEYLRKTQLPLDVCPSSNVCLRVFASIKQHILPKLLDEGLYVTINSDDPPMFNTTLTREYQLICQEFGFDRKMVEKFMLNAIYASLLPNSKKEELLLEIQTGFKELE
jgi:adenosine deaminase